MKPLILICSIIPLVGVVVYYFTATPNTPENKAKSKPTLVSKVELQSKVDDILARGKDRSNDLKAKLIALDLERSEAAKSEPPDRAAYLADIEVDPVLRPGLREVKL
jgi:hypothetical protein